MNHSSLLAGLLLLLVAATAAHADEPVLHAKLRPVKSIAKLAEEIPTRLAKRFAKDWTMWHDGVIVAVFQLNPRAITIELRRFMPPNARNTANCALSPFGVVDIVGSPEATTVNVVETDFTYLSKVGVKQLVDDGGKAPFYLQTLDVVYVE